MSDGPKLPLSRAQHVAEELLTLIGSSCSRVEIAGSIRRMRPQVGDIEIVAIPKISRVEVPGQLFAGEQAATEERNELWTVLERFVPKFIRAGDRYRQFTWPVDDHMEVDRHLSIKVDVFTAKPDTWGNILLIRTGSALFGHHVVTRLAMNRTPSFDGAVRNAAGVDPDEIRENVPRWDEKRKAAMPAIPTPEEADVFRLAGMKYVPPAQRNWQ